MAHIHLISSQGAAAQSGTRTDTTAGPFADTGDTATSSFEVLLALGRDRASAGQTPLQPSGDKSSADAVEETTSDLPTNPPQLAQLPEAPGSVSPVTQDETGSSLSIAQASDGGTDEAVPTDPASTIVSLTLDAPDPGQEVPLSPPAARAAYQKPVLETPAATNKGAGDPLATTLQPSQMAANPDAQAPQPAAPGNNIAIAAQTTLPAAQAGTAPPAASAVSIDVPEALGTSAWTNSFSQKVVVSIGRNEQLAEIRINPPHLGPVEVKLTMSGDDNRVANVHFTAHQANVREAIENAIPRLREMFGEAGISLGNTTVGSDTSGREAGGSERGNVIAERAADGDADGQSALATSTTQVNIIGKVDTFA